MTPPRWAWLRTCAARSCAAQLAWLLAWAGCASALKPLPESTRAGAERNQEDADLLYADLRTLLHEIENQPSAKARETMATDAVRLGQRCELAAPESARCDYALGLALGAQARERPSTAHDGLPLMIQRLERAAKRDPRLDRAGPERVLGLVLTRAPAWPTGPGDPVKGLEAARKAVEREPEYAPNWLAVAEAAGATGDTDARREAARKAAELATQAEQAGTREAEAWQRAAKEMLSP